MVQKRREEMNIRFLPVVLGVQELKTERKWCQRSCDEFINGLEIKRLNSLIVVNSIRGGVWPDHLQHFDEKPLSLFVESRMRFFLSLNVTYTLFWQKQLHLKTISVCMTIPKICKWDWKSSATCSHGLNRAGVGGYDTIQRCLENQKVAKTSFYLDKKEQIGL